MGSEMPSINFGHWCIMRFTVYPGLVSCPFYAISIVPFQIYEFFYILVIISVDYTLSWCGLDISMECPY